MLQSLADNDIHPAPALVHVCDADPGFGRRRCGKGFAYYDENGARITDRAAVQRIKALAIPPAWTDVWICPDPRGHVQATGRDARGRKQYRYHPDWLDHRGAAKYLALPQFARALPRLRSQVADDLCRSGLPWERVGALIVWLLDHTLIRVGNVAYARDNRSFGLTTLRNRHVDVGQTRLRFAFRGKSGKEWTLALTDRRIARIVRTVQELPGQDLFQYLDEDGARHPVRSHDVNAYIRAAAGDDFSSKDFRTWGGTVRAAMLFAETDRPETKAEIARAANAVVDAVASRLGNTRAVCRSAYVHPAVEQSWREGRLDAEIAAVRRSRRKALPGLDDPESIVLEWLERFGAQA